MNNKTSLSEAILLLSAVIPKFARDHFHHFGHNCWQDVNSVQDMEVQLSTLLLSVERSGVSSAQVTQNHRIQVVVYKDGDGHWRGMFQVVAGSILV